MDVPIVIKINSVWNVTNQAIQDIDIESGIKSEILLLSSTYTVSIGLDILGNTFIANCKQRGNH